MRSDKEDRRPLAALLAVFTVAIVFWAIFKQNGTALTKTEQHSLHGPKAILIAKCHSE